jgi:RNA polymerase sigma-70 factor (ECF subfamily)
MGALEGEWLGADPDGFARFYREALPRVYGYFLYRCGGSAVIAEDLTQETFLAAVAELKRGRQVETPLAWIHGIARHKLIDHYRRTGRSERVIAGDELVEGELPMPADDESREATAAALGRVPAAQRAALVLRHVDGFSVPEVAEMLGRSVEAVESLLARGRVSLRRAYLEETG